MISWIGQWTRMPSTTLSSQKHEMLVFGLHSTSGDWPGWSMHSNPICHLSPAKKLKCSFLDYIQLLMISRAGRWNWTPSTTSLQPKKMKCSFLDYIQILMISQAGWWTRTPSATPLQPKEWNPNFWNTFNFSCWPGWSMDSNCICHPFPAKKMKCSFLEYVQLLMISLAGQWTWTPSATSLQPKKWNAHFWITFNFWWSAGLVDRLEPHLPPLSSHKNEMLIFGLRSTSDDQLDWSMDLNPIYHLSPAKNMKCLFLDNVQLLMISQAGRWTWAPSATPLQPKKMKCSFLDYVQLLMISPAGQWTQIPSATSLQPKKWNVHFWITFNFWWSARLVNGLKSHLPPLSSQKNEMFIFGLHSTSDDWSDWLMDSNPIHHPSPAKKMKCSFLGYVQLLMISQAGQWTRTPSATPLQPKTWNAHFWITFNFWCSAGLVNGLECHPPPFSSQKKLNAHFKIMFSFWRLAGLVNGLKPHLPPLSSQKNEMLVFGLPSTSDDWPGWSMDSNPSCHPSPANKMKCSFLDYIQLLMFSRPGRWIWTPSATPLQPKTWNAHFWITFNFQWSARLVNGLKLHLPALSSKKMKCLFLDYLQLLMIGRAGRRNWTPSTTSLQPKKWNAHFWITFNFWWLAGLVDGLEPCVPPLCSQKNEMPIFRLHSTSDDWPGWSKDSNLICHPSPAKNMKCLFLDYIQLLMIGQAGRCTRTPFATSLQPKNEMLIFALHSTPDDQPGWSMDSNPIYHLSPATKIKCSFLDYVQLLMISWNGQCHPPPLSSQKHEMLVFGLHSTSGDWPGWSMHSNPICHLSPAKKLKCSFLDYIQLLMISRAGQWNWTPSTTSLQPKKMKCSFLDYIQILMISQAGWWTRTPSATPLQPKEWNPNFWNTFNFSCLAGLVDGLKLHLPPISSQKNEMLIFGLCSTSDDQPGWSMDLNPICNPSPANKMKCSFLEYIQLLMISQAG